MDKTDSNNFLIEHVYEWGIPLSTLRKVYENALNESYALCKENDVDFILKIMKELLQKDNNLSFNFAENFIKSPYKDFNEFCEFLFTEDGSGMMSTDFAPDQRPQGSLHSVHTIADPVVDEDENELEYEIEK